jgi:hypothetical protein
MPNIVFIGKAGAGKTTVARLLRERFPDLGFETISFAEPLKVMLNTTTDRERLQQFGTNIVRAYEPDAWVRMFLWHLELRNTIRFLNAPVDGRHGNIRWCNDDCRFPNEIETLRDRGWAVVEVIAPTPTRLERLRRNGKLQDDSQLEHESETALNGVVPDATVLNMGDEEELALKLTAALSLLHRL